MTGIERDERIRKPTRNGQGRAWVFTAFVGCLFLVRVAAAGEIIRIAIADGRPEIGVESASGLLVDGIRGGQGRKRKITPPQIGKQPVRIASPGAFLRINGKSYRGLIEIRKKANGLLLAINELDIEDYLKGVVSAEVPRDWEPEALKAQAVAARTYALYRKRASASRPYHMLATVDSQVYAGRSGEHQAAVRAVRETEGIVITYEGKLIPSYYHSSCGGHTENAFELWGIDEPYLQGVDCECQKISPYGVWEKRITLGRVSAALRKMGYPAGRIYDVRLDGITPAGRVKQLAVRHAGGNVSVPAEKFRAAIGYGLIPSIFFDIETTGEEIVLSGRGLGHGVGLCQWGAREMAQRGLDFTTILEHYYPGTRLEKLQR